MVSVVIVSDIRLYREGLAHVLGREPRLEVVGAHATVADALLALARSAADIVLLDTANPDALAELQVALPSLQNIRVVALGVARRDGDVIACAEAGVAGYVFRDASLEELVVTVETSARGELHCSPEMAATLLRRVANLAARREVAVASHNVTQREREIVDLIDQGLSNKQIAARLCIEVATVKNHIHNVLEKLGARTRAEAAAKMRRAPGNPSSGFRDGGSVRYEPRI
jgi:DNA-binding NarL/FixJ family response regulator